MMYIVMVMMKVSTDKVSQESQLLDLVRCTNKAHSQQQATETATAVAVAVASSARQWHFW